MKFKQIVWGVYFTSLILIFVSASAKKTKAKPRFSRKKIAGRVVKTIRVVDINDLCTHHETMFTGTDEVYNPKQDTEELICAKGSTCIEVK